VAKKERKKQITKEEKEAIKKEKEKIFEAVEKSGFRGNRTLGQKAADSLTRWAGSWAFIIGFLIFLVLWMILNVHILSSYGKEAFDKYPFILLNLVLSCVAAIQAPIILMSQNRAAQRDRLKAEYDYRINKKAEQEIREIKNLLLKKPKNN